MQPQTVTGINRSLVGRYELIGELGSGGMAHVYLARDVRHHREVALKVLRPELASALGADRFLREIELAARLSHPHIVPLYDSGEADGLLFYVMPRVRGDSLRQLLAREGHLPLDRAIELTRQVASALDYAHSQQVVHRDIKPENILLHAGEAMVTDFGIALAVSAAGGERMTQTGFAMGTPDYMSPEQTFAERDTDHRSDVYSLGCVVYEMLAGAPPFTGTPMTIAAQRLRDAPPDVRRVRSTVPVHVGRAIAKAMARSPGDRFESASAFVAALAVPEASKPKSKSVAVLPFLNLSANPENEYFSDGITEDIIANLSKIRSLKVISRTSVMPFKSRDRSLRDIASALEAATLLEGSVRRVGDRVRVVAQLIDGESDEHLWAETYDRELTDVFAIQTDVALRIAGALQAELTVAETTRIKREPTHDMSAYNLYQQGRHELVKYTAESMRKAVDLFEQAIERDPDLALAHVGIATAYGELGETGSMDAGVAYRRARIAATRALELDPELGEAHCVLAVVKRGWDYDWEGAEEEYKRALELNPNAADALDMYGRLCADQERYDEALALLRKANEVDPMAHKTDIVTTLLRAARYDEAYEAGRRAVTFDPSFDRAHMAYGWACLRTGRTDEGLEEIRTAVALTPDSTAWLAQLGQAYGETGDREQARAILRQLQTLAATRYVSPYHMAYVYTGLGEHDSAIDWLERAAAERAGAVFGIKGSFLFAPLRPHPRFAALLGRMRLTPR